MKFIRFALVFSLTVLGLHLCETSLTHAEEIVSSVKIQKAAKVKKAALKKAKKKKKVSKAVQRKLLAFQRSGGTSRGLLGILQNSSTFDQPEESGNLEQSYASSREVAPTRDPLDRDDSSRSINPSPFSVTCHGANIVQCDNGVCGIGPYSGNNFFYCHSTSRNILCCSKQEHFLFSIMSSGGIIRYCGCD